VKAALESPPRYMAAELGPKGIRVHGNLPGPLKTRARQASPSSTAPAKAEEKAPSRSLVSIDDVGARVAFPRNQCRQAHHRARRCTSTAASQSLIDARLEHAEPTHVLRHSGNSWQWNEQHSNETEPAKLPLSPAQQAASVTRSPNAILRQMAAWTSPISTRGGEACRRRMAHTSRRSGVGMDVAERGSASMPGLSKTFGDIREKSMFLVSNAGIQIVHRSTEFRLRNEAHVGHPSRWGISHDQACLKHMYKQGSALSYTWLGAQL